MAAGAKLVVRTGEARLTRTSFSVVECLSRVRYRIYRRERSRFLRISHVMFFRKYS